MTISDQERDFILEYGRQACEMYPDRQWSEVEPFLQHVWEELPRRPGWEEVKPLMREGWELFCAGHLEDSR